MNSTDVRNIAEEMAAADRLLNTYRSEQYHLGARIYSDAIKKFMMGTSYATTWEMAYLRASGWELVKTKPEAYVMYNPATRESKVIKR